MPSCQVCCHDWLFFKCVSHRYKSRRDSDIPRLVAFPEHDVLHICTSIKDRVATAWMWRTGTSVTSGNQARQCGRHFIWPAKWVEVKFPWSIPKCLHNPFTALKQQVFIESERGLSVAEKHKPREIFWLSNSPWGITISHNPQWPEVMESKTQGGIAWQRECQGRKQRGETGLAFPCPWPVLLSRLSQERACTAMLHRRDGNWEGTSIGTPFRIQAKNVKLA